VNQTDDRQIAFWQRREADERAIAAGTAGEAQIIHMTLADNYARLLAKASNAARKKPEFPANSSHEQDGKWGQ
jgi:hypothetical protein